DSSELFLTREFWNVRDIKLSRGTDQGVEFANLALIAVFGNHRLPNAGLLIPGGTDQLCAVLDFFGQTSLGGYRLQVLPHFFTLCELVRPVGLLGEGIRVSEGRGIQSHPRVLVLLPGSAQTGA